MIFSHDNMLAMALAPDADRYNANPATDIFDMKMYDHICFLLCEGTGGTGTVKIQVEECSDTSGTDNTAIAAKYRVCSSGDTWGALTTLASTGYTTTAGANKMVCVELDAADLDPAKPFVRLQLTEVADSPCDAGVVAILSKARYFGASLPTSIV